jgi:hypothetical protein
MHMVSCGAKPSTIEEQGVAGGPGGLKSSVSYSSGAGLEQS